MELIKPGLNLDNIRTLTIPVPPLAEQQRIVAKVDAYLDDHGLRREAMFHQLLQALIELSPAGSEERSLLESISNHVQARGEAPKPKPGLFDGNLIGQDA